MIQRVARYRVSAFAAAAAFHLNVANDGGAADGDDRHSIDADVVAAASDVSVGVVALLTHRCQVMHHPWVHRSN